MKKFKVKKKIKKKMFILMFLVSYVVSLCYCYKNNISKSVIKKDINYINYNIVDKFNNIVKTNINNPVKMLNYNIKNITSKKTITTKTGVLSNNIYEPVIYIYNTHSSELYNDYSVYELSEELTNKLNANGLDTYFEEKSVATFLSSNNMNYSKSYDVSRTYINDAINTYKTLKYFIDIHRDSVSKPKATITYNNINYAKVMFIIGLDNNNYNNNYNNSYKLNELINDQVPGISRGIYKKQGKGVNGLYNQDISENLFLIEVGAKDSTKQEVLNTLEVIYNALALYINGEV